jgi:hypothetical protein
LTTSGSHRIIRTRLSGDVTSTFLSKGGLPIVAATLEPERNSAIAACSREPAAQHRHARTGTPAEVFDPPRQRQRVCKAIKGLAAVKPSFPGVACGLAGFGGRRRTGIPVASGDCL